MLQKSNSKYLEIETISFKIKKNCNLGKKETLIFSRPDQIITPNLMKKGEWDYFIVSGNKQQGMTGNGEFTLGTSSEIREQLPLGHQLYVDYVEKILSVPDKNLIESLFPE